MSDIFNLEAKDIKNLSLKLDGKLPVNRDELLALVNTWKRKDWFYTYDENHNVIETIKCEANEKYDLSKLDVSEIKDFDDIFKYSNFDGDINSWNVSKATSMAFMFYKNKNFNSPLDKWDVSNVTDISSMFSCAIKFNQNINMWNVSKVTSMNSIFFEAINFNQPLDKWNTSLVTSMYAMFTFAENFNQNLNSLDISKVKNMDYIFEDSKKFNQAILWDLSNVESCYGIFNYAEAFENKFNKGNPLSYETNKIKEWLIDNRNSMIAIDIEHSKGEELDNFLSNFDIIDSANLNGLHNNKEIYNENI